MGACLYFLFKPSSPPPLFVFFNHKQQVLSVLPERLKQIHTLMPVWIYLKNEEGEIAHHSLNQQQEVEQIVKMAGSTTKIVPVINNHNGIDWQVKTVESLFRDRGKQQIFLDKMVAYLKKSQFQMINFDFEGFPEELIPSYMAFLEGAAERLHQEKLAISVCVSPYWAPSLQKSLMRSIDQIILMVYDEHWSTSKPGPISSQPWFEKVFLQFYDMFPPEKLVIGIGNYGYDWPLNGSAVDLSVTEVRNLAARHQSEVLMDDPSKNPMFRYEDEKGIHHEVWFLDASTFKQQYTFLKGRPVAGAALWQMGSEDPLLWTTLKEP